MIPLPLPSLSRGGGLPPTACGPATSKTPAEVGVSRVLDLTKNTEAGRSRQAASPTSNLLQDRAWLERASSRLCRGARP